MRRLFFELNLISMCASTTNGKWNWPIFNTVTSDNLLFLLVYFYRLYEAASP